MMVKEDESNEPIVKMRGLPWSATVDDIISFLENANIKNGRAGVHITMSREGRPSGEAFIELESEADLEQAMKKDKQHMGHRYIEIFSTNRADMDWYIERSGSNVENVMDECCIRLRGLPYGCTKNDITQFFEGLTIVPNGISFVSDQTGRNTGEAYVQFSNKEMVEKALKKHLDKIGHRYIEIFRSSLAEIRSQTGPKIRPLMSEMVPRPSPYDRSERFGGSNRMGNRGPPPMPPMNRGGGRDFGDDDWDNGNNWGSGMGGGNGGMGGGSGGMGSGGMRKPGGFRDSGIPSLTKSRISPPPATRMRNMMYGNGNGMDEEQNWNDDDDQRFVVHMRGLPYRATEQDIFNFFRPLIPINVHILYERSGRPSGEANVEFETYEDAERAMVKDKQNMNNRYIELFLRATPPVRSLMGGGGGGRNAGLGGFNDSPDPLFSRRGGGGSGGNVSNSAYDGFFGTSLYRAASSAGGGNYMR